MKWGVEIGDTFIQETYESIFGSELTIPDIDLKDMTMDIITQPLVIDSVQMGDKTKITIVDNIMRGDTEKIKTLVDLFALREMLPIDRLADNLMSGIKNLELGVPGDVQEVIDTVLEMVNGDEGEGNNKLKRK